jgi:outer membrane receptor protein involved in Fe transport
MKSLLLAGAAVVWTGIAHAQPAESPPAGAPVADSGDVADASDSGEIVVTARKRSESLLKVPVSVGVVTGEKIEKYNIADLEGAAKTIPNFYIGKQPSIPNIALRGIGTLATSNSVEQSVGLSVDNVYFGRGRWFQVGLFDIQQVEVLRGPQGVYFGKNTPAGLINIRTKGPGNDLEGYVKAGYEFKYREKLIEGAIGGPISDTFGARLAVQYRNADGWMRNTATGRREPSLDQIVGRLTLDWKPTEDVHVVYKGQYVNSKIDGKQEENECTPALAAAFQAQGLTEDCVINGGRSGGNSVVGAAFPFDRDFINTKGQSHGLTIDWNIGDFTVTSVTAYQKIKVNMAFDTDFRDAKLLSSNWPEDSHAFTQEVRVLTPADKVVQALIGAYYEDNKLTWDTVLDFSFGSRPRIFKQHGKSWAVFGELTWNITDSIRLIGGGRYTKDKKIVDFDYRKGGPLGDPFGLPSPATFTGLGFTDIFFNGSKTFDNFSPSIIGQWDVSPTTMAYASFKKGFKSGGFDSGRTGAQAVPFGPVVPGLEFEPEKVDAWEGGLKTRALNNRLTLSIAGFYTKIKDLQETVFNPATQSSTLLNAASATIKGFEADATLNAMEGLNFNAAVGLADSKYDEYPNANCRPGQTVAQGCIDIINPITNVRVGGRQDLKGASLPTAPKWTANVGFDYTHPVTDSLNLELGGQANYRSKVYLTPENDPNQAQKGFWLLDARIGIASANRMWSLAVVGQNLTNKGYFVGSVPLGFLPTGFASGTGFARGIGNPRTVQVEATLRFGGSRRAAPAYSPPPPPPPPPPPATQTCPDGSVIDAAMSCPPPPPPPPPLPVPERG